jgi:SET domain-containing protein
MPPPSEPPVVARESPIHGFGLFAARDIAAGERILEYKGERVIKTESLRRARAREKTNPNPAQSIFLFELDSAHDLDGDIPDNPAKFINHSCDENCEALFENGGIWIYAKRRIATGAELTFDYAFALESFFEHPCRCRAPSCPGYIVARPLRPLLRRMLARRRC